MNKTKKGFLIAGGILAVIGAALSIILSLVIQSLDIEAIRELFVEEIAEMTPEEAETMLLFIKELIGGVSIFTIAFSVVNLVLGILIIVKTKNETISKGLIITELVFSILGSGTLTMIFMIVALCLKDEPTKPKNSDVDTIEI